MKRLLESEGIFLSVQTVRKYMNVELGLRSVTRKKKRIYKKGPDPHKIFDDLLEQDFCAEQRNQKWCVDFTYLHFDGNKRRYNCTILDLYDRRVVASVNGARIDADLAIAAVQKALQNVGGETGMILHSDRGSQFTSERFIEYCSDHGIVQSMSRPGCPYDNAPMERYFNTLKEELIKLKEFSTEKMLYTEINAYAYGWYNNKRPHSYNGGTPPAKVA